MDAKPIDTIPAFEVMRNRQRAGNCPFCKNAVDPDGFKDALSKREFEISGLCQPCQDGFFEGGDAE